MSIADNVDNTTAALVVTVKVAIKVRIYLGLDFQSRLDWKPVKTLVVNGFNVELTLYNSTDASILTETTCRKLGLNPGSPDWFLIGTGDMLLNITGPADVTIKSSSKTIMTAIIFLKDRNGVYCICHSLDSSTC